MGILMYGSEKLSTVVTYLALSDKPPRARLADVIGEVGVLHGALDYQTMPQDLRNRLDTLDKELRANGTYPATIGAMSDEQVSKTIEEIVGLFSDVTMAYGASQR